MANPVFRKESLDKVSSPEQLNDYIKVANVSVWIIIAAAIVLIAAVFVWGVAGQLDTTVNVSGVAKNGVVTCYLPGVSAVEIGDSARIGTLTGEISEIAATPVSAKSLSGEYDEYTVYSLALSDWNYAVTVSVPDVPNGIVSLELITESVSPISFIWD